MSTTQYSEATPEPSIAGLPSPLLNVMQRTSRILANSVIAGTLLYVTIEIMLHVIRKDYNPACRFLSEYAVGPFGILGTVAFCLLAATTLALAITLLLQVQLSWLLVLTCCLLCVASLGFCALALFPTDLSPPQGGPPPIRTSIGVVHDTCTNALSVALGLAALLLPCAYKRDARWRNAFSRILLFGIFIPLFLCIASILPWHWRGLGQRLVVASGLIWMVANGLLLRAKVLK